MILFWARVGIGIGAVTYLLIKVDLSQMWAELNLAWKRPFLVILAGMVFLLFLGLRTLRWYVLAKVRGYPYGFFYLYRGIIIHHLFNLALPTTIGGDVYRIADTSGYRGAESAFSVVWTGRLCGFTGMFTFAFAGSIVFAVLFGNLTMMWILGAGFIFSVAIITVFLSKKINNWLAPRLTRFRIYKFRVGERIAKALTYVTFYHDHTSVIIAAIGISLLVQTALAVTWYLLYLSLSPLEKASYVQFMITIPLVKTAALFSVGGWGAREAAFVNIMGAFKVSLSEATAFANSILFDTVNVFYAGIGGLLLLFHKIGTKREKPS